MFTRCFANMFVLLAMVLAAFGTPVSVLAATPNGVDHLRGRWEGEIANLRGDKPSFTLLLNKFETDPNDPLTVIYGGCIAVGQNAYYTPISAQVLITGNEQFALTLFGTAATNSEAFVIKLVGTGSTSAAKVKDDLASGTWETADQQGNWSAIHHDRRNPKCPAVQVNNNLFFHPDVYAGVNVSTDEERNEGTLLEGYTNIVSSGMKVETPDGSFLTVPFYTDLFSPFVDFINEFRFLTNLPGLPQTSTNYRFTLLDAFGQPIPGSTTMDNWFGCTMGPPQNVSTSVDTAGLGVIWDPVTPAPGFDPGGSPQLGFYQIELSGYFGSNGIKTAAHLIPFADFGGFALGTPDGFDNGIALDQFADGVYAFEVIAFSEPAPGSGGVGLECQIRDQREQTLFEKAGAVYTILP